MTGLYNPETAPYYDPATQKRVAVVTGGNSGIGWWTVLHFYLHGFTVYVAGRTELKVLAAIEGVKKEAAARHKTGHLGSLHYIKLDCLDLDLVAACADELRKREPRIHVLVNNAGIMAVPFEMSKDGFEVQYQVNFVAPFLLTLRLVPSLEAAQVDARPRVVFVSSIGHNMAQWYYEPTDPIRKLPDFLFAWVRYGNAKTAEILLSKKLAQKYPNIESHAVHPGLIFDTGLYDTWNNKAGFGRLFRLLTGTKDSLVGVSPEQGSLATLRAAWDAGLDNGAYLTTGGALSRSSRITLNQKNMDKTWDVTFARLADKGYLE